MKTYVTKEEWRAVNQVLTSASQEFDRNGPYLLQGSVVVSVLARSPPSNNPTSPFHNMATILVQVLYKDGSYSSEFKLAFDANPANSKENKLEQILSVHEGKQLEGTVGVRFSRSATPNVRAHYLRVHDVVEAVVVGNRVVDYHRYAPKSVEAIIQK